MIVFLFYLVVMLVIFTLCAVIADLWLAHDERRERAEARSKLREEREH